MIYFKCISFAYGENSVFKDFTLSLSAPVTVIEGASGSGKTTLLKLMAGLIAPNLGTIEGAPKKPAVMFQENRLLPWLTARENVAAVMQKEDAGKADKWLQFVELSQISESLPENMSGGQQRRVAMARMLAFGGGMLIMDEPLKGLDQELIQRLVPKIKALDIPIVVTSHSELETTLWGGEKVIIRGVQSAEEITEKK